MEIQTLKKVILDDEMVKAFSNAFSKINDLLDEIYLNTDGNDWVLKNDNGTTYCAEALKEYCDFLAFISDYEPFTLVE